MLLSFVLGLTIGRLSAKRAVIVDRETLLAGKVAEQDILEADYFILRETLCPRCKTRWVGNPPGDGGF